PGALIPINYSGDSVHEHSRIIRIEPSKRNTLVTRHGHGAADYKENSWLLRKGDTDIWYGKPARSLLKQINALEGSGIDSTELSPMLDARPVSLEVPKLCVSKALTTPTDDDVYDCSAGHTIDGGYAGTCHQCSEQKSDALEATDLEYTLIITTCQASNPFIQGAHFNGRQIYKMTRHSSREAAVAEAFYASGVNGWNVVFSCVTRVGESFEDRTGKVSKVEELWQLADDAADDKVVRIFY
ncbi:hypothetical protein BKA63DRAFT_428001, partial [Paraphoma chrysanthemicola]